MSKRRGLLVAVLLAPLVLTAAVSAHAQDAWTVNPAWISAHENFLASPALRGRGSATPDEGVAATYVASVFQSYGLTPAPGMTGYLQTAPVTKSTPSGHSVLTVGDVTVAQGEGLTVLLTSGGAASGPLTIAGDDPAALPSARVVLIAPPEGPSGAGMINAAEERGAELVILRETDFLNRIAVRYQARTSFILSETPKDKRQIDVVIVSAAVYDRLKAQADAAVTLDPGAVQQVETVTTNAIGYLAGSDPAAGYILISAHLDHLGVKDGVLYPGANDDASGTTAVMELAHALAAGPQPRRGVLFVAYGSEEVGGLGSTFFGEHPPVPLEQIVANLEIEMIAGGQDPKLPAGVMMMTGYERSNFGPELKARGALIAPDAYPEQNFFRRSDNYSLALKGIVAHTISAYPTPDTYHQPTDDLAHVDLPFMTQAIQSLIEPMRWLATSDFKPEWTEGGRPVAGGR
ncbi:M20/M25/M40 family metallo-hydrolase [soil metagenome]